MGLAMEAVEPGIIEDAAAEVKAWLRIDTAQDDAAIAALVRSAIGAAEDYCAQTLFLRGGKEVLAATGEWVRLLACPVASIMAARGLPAEGASFVLASDAWSADIGADGDGWVRVRRTGAAGRVEVDLTAGIADGWASLPDGLRQGIVRLAAHLFAQQEAGEPVPAIVSALWRPWRRMRIA